MRPRFGLQRAVDATLGSIGANIRRLRNRRDPTLTQEKLAEDSDVDLRFLQEVEAGKSNLSIAILVAIARALDVRPQDLMRPAKLPKPLRGRPPKRRTKTTTATER